MSVDLDLWKILEAMIKSIALKLLPMWPLPAAFIIDKAFNLQAIPRVLKSSFEFFGSRLARNSEGTK
jgi:hypothetical protein